MAATMLRKQFFTFASKHYKTVSPVRCYRAMSSTTKEMEDLVVTEKMEDVFLIGLNRPAKRNAVNFTTADKLSEAFQKFEEDNDLLVAVLYGKGGNFCAGMDLKEVSEQSSDVIDVYNKPLQEGRGPMGPTKMIFSKPVIAAISGYAVAGGMELALMCDLRVIEETAKMGIFNRRFGVPLIDGGTIRLPHLIGLSRALDLIMTGREIGAKEALEFGLANQIVPIGTGLGRAMMLAKSLTKFPQECLRRDRLSAYHTMFNVKSMEEAFEFELKNSKHVLAQEAIKGATRFTEGVGRSGSFNLNKKSKL